ncbi:MAG: hypothetical protein AABY22_27625 [Nanoarchaeota archaeon]
MEEETKIEREMKLIINITLYLLLALAFLGIYEVNNNIKAPNPFIMELFISGIFILFFAFMSYISPEAKIFRGITFRRITYFLVIIALILFLNLFANKYHESISSSSDKIVDNLAESFIKIRIQTFLHSETFWIIGILIELLLIWTIYYQKFSPLTL